MKPEQAREIIADAPEGATHVEFGGDGEYLKFNNESKEDSWHVWSDHHRRWDNGSRFPIYYFNDIRSLSDLRLIVEQAERIERMQAKIEKAAAKLRNVEGAEVTLALVYLGGE